MRHHLLRFVKEVFPGETGKRAVKQDREGNGVPRSEMQAKHWPLGPHRVPRVLMTPRVFLPPVGG